MPYIWKCPACGKNTDTEQELIDHIREQDAKHVKVNKHTSVVPEEVEISDEAADHIARFKWMKNAVQLMANDYNKEFPNAGRGSYKYVLWNTVIWE